MKKIIDDKWEITLPYTCDNFHGGTGNGSDTRIPNQEKISVTFNDKPSTVEAWIADWKKRIESSAKESLEGFYKFFEPIDRDNINELGFKLRKPKCAAYLIFLSKISIITSPSSTQLWKQQE